MLERCWQRTLGSEGSGQRTVIFSEVETAQVSHTLVKPWVCNISNGGTKAIKVDGERTDQFRSSSPPKAEWLPDPRCLYVILDNDTAHTRFLLGPQHLVTAKHPKCIAIIRLQL